MATLKTLIVDDEAIARRGLRRLLQQEADLEVIGECASGREALEAIRSLKPDLVFLDVQMPEMNGFDVLRALQAELLPYLVFVTAYDEYALRAFEVQAVDYLLKPFSGKRLEQALERVRLQIRSEKKANELSRRLAELLNRMDPKPPPHPAFLRRIALKESGKVSFVNVEDVSWIEAADNYICLHVGNRSHLLRGTLTDIEQKLDPDQFVRVHRSRIVNIGWIREMHPLSSGDCLLVMHDGTEITSSRTYAENRRRILQPLS